MQENSQLLKDDMPQQLSTFNPRYDGEKIDENLKFGCQNKRSMHDVICIIIFGFFIFSLAGSSIQFIQQGNPKKLMAPFDSSGNQCGIEEANEFPYLYFKNPILNLSEFSCVKECPTEQNQIQKLDCIESIKQQFYKLDNF
ncbi:hypothetical protein PPERSA_06277 [Pseudocohnilembus persalinus]|uniref:Transmembrane protein n=1 Tax=Pseudocohnilembus persalinus TaxID=266149 RepID=A0A0V0QVQ9_PSEPJ|nr:hypothetical protein PPERSA_06277 [Pseudocohnilembus persalinus]|eukprot:KRX06306.1 hypothetical protein PPERSA_06277 [Pseudocohnilembus persalinus]